MARLQPKTGQRRATVAIDQSVALELSGRLGDKHRLVFARDFAAAVAQSFAEAAKVSLPSPWRPNIDGEAQELAGGIGRSLPADAPERAVYAIGRLYTALLPEAFRAQHGIFYTPPELVDCLLAMAEEAGIDWTGARVLDPACGGGAFLVGSVLRMVASLDRVEPGIALQNIAGRLRGFDLDPFGAWLAQAMLCVALGPLVRAARRELASLVDCRDSLDLKAEEANSYDLVIGNPPYGRTSLSPGRRSQFARSIYGHANLYGVFTDAALHWAKPGGVVAYVTPTSMLSGLYYKALRELLASEAPPVAISFVGERNGVFADVLQETMLATYRRSGVATPGTVGFIAAADGQVVKHKGGSFTLPTVAHAPWLLPRAENQQALTKRLRAMRHRLSDYGYGVSTGPLVWNRFKEQFQMTAAKATFPVIWAESITSDGRFAWRSEKRNHLPWFAARRPKDDWLIVTRPCVLLQRTTAKEQPRRLIAAELSQSFIRRHGGVIVENHLNMVRAIDDTPKITPAVIAALLNSKSVDAAFRCINGSVAVSAFELEELPLPEPAIMAKLAQLVAQGAERSAIEAVIAQAYGRRDVAAAA